MLVLTPDYVTPDPNCDPASTAWSAVGVQAPDSRPVPDVLLCQLSSTVGPNVREGIDITGPVTGTGSCRSAQGAWDLTYSGTWNDSDLGTLNHCTEDNFGWITVTNRATGKSQPRVPGMDAGDAVYAPLDARPVGWARGSDRRRLAASYT